MGSWKKNIGNFHDLNPPSEWTDGGLPKLTNTQIGQVVAALFATDCFMCTVVQNHQAYKCRVS